MRSENLTQPKLTVAIPTFNRAAFLERALLQLEKQWYPGMEILVLDNASTDGTREMLERFAGWVRVIRSEENVGADRNVVACLDKALGEFVLLLGDDDLVCTNAIAELRSAMSSHPCEDVFVMRTVWTARTDEQETLAQQTESTWQLLKRDEFLQAQGMYVTTLSGIVVRQSAIDWLFVLGAIGSELTPAALLLSAVGTGGKAVLSAVPLVSCRGGAGGYDAAIIFSAGINRLLEKAKRYGYGSGALRWVQQDFLRNHLPYTVSGRSIGMSEAIALWRSAWNFSDFYRCVLPVLLRSARKQTRAWLSRKVRRAICQVITP